MKIEMSCLPCSCSSISKKGPIFCAASYTCSFTLMVMFSFPHAEEKKKYVVCSASSSGWFILFFSLFLVCKTLNADNPTNHSWILAVDWYIRRLCRQQFKVVTGLLLCPSTTFSHSTHWSDTFRHPTMKKSVAGLLIPSSRCETPYSISIFNTTGVYFRCFPLALEVIQWTIDLFYPWK